MKFNARRVAAGGTAFLVGGLAVAVLGGALTDLPLRTQDVADEASELSDLRSALLALKDRVDTNNKRWYASWQGEFLVGTPERDALSQIDTGAPTPLPEALLIAPPLVAVDAATVQVDYVPGGGAHASELMLQFYIEGEPEWGFTAFPCSPELSTRCSRWLASFSSRLMHSASSAQNVTPSTTTSRGAKWSCIRN